MNRLLCTSALALVLSVATAGSGLAQAPSQGEGAGGTPEQAGAPETSDKPSAQQTPPSIATSLGPLGDLWGLGPALEKRGITFSLTYIGETLGNRTGGVKRGSIYEGRLDGQLDVDLEKLVGWSGATFHTNGYQIHGHGLSKFYLDNLMTASGIEALPSTRLYELWLEQKMLNDKVAVRVGQLAADTEFLVSQYATLFVNGTFGWPGGDTGVDLPSGGPAYPLATPAVRLKIAPTDEVSILAALFNGDPAGPARFFANPDPQRRNRNGLDFRTTDPAFLIGEAAWTYNQGKDAAGLPGTIKLGGWAHLGRRFQDQRFDNIGLSLADPDSTGIARRFRGNAGIYGVLDQMIYRVPGTTDQGLGVFARVAGSPADRNLISFYADGGFTYKGLIPGRGDDTFGVSFGYAQISQRARNLDRDTRLFAAANAFDPDFGAFNYTGPALPVRSSEALLEVTYQAQIIPGWTIQPDFQYVIRPSGGIPNDRDPNGTVIKNAAIFGIRSTMRFATGGSAPETPRKEEPPASAPVSGFNWSGFYVGANAGYGTAGRNRDDICGTGTFGFLDCLSGNALSVPSASNGALVPVTPLAGFGQTGFAFGDRRNRNGFAGGGQIGYNYQPNPGSGWVFGIEADGQRTSFSRRRHDTVFRSPGGRVFTAAPNVTAPNVTAPSDTAPSDTDAGITDASVQVLGPTPGVGIADPIEGSAGNVALFNANPRGFDRSRIDWFATVRGRLGYAFDRVLIYGTGGIAYAGRPDSPNRCPTCNAFGLATPGIADGQALVGTGFYVSEDAETAGGAVVPSTPALIRDRRGNDVGWTAGGGIEFALTDNLTAKIEGLYVAFGGDRNRNGCCLDGGALVGVVGVTNTGAPVVANQLGVRVDDRRRSDDIGLVRVGLNWKFNTP